MEDDGQNPYGTTQPGVTTVGTQTLVPGLNTVAGPLVLPAVGYALGDMIGRGGMGEVVAARDLRIGRDVAIKRMRAETPSQDALDRFLREARVQARLDHPAIVPVHELGLDDHGKPYFTMKKLSGATFAQRMTDGTPLVKLLRFFTEVCRAVEFAHARGVVHRDLKPANVMVGDYGEVYVLDWGIARVLGEAVATGGISPVNDVETLEGTQTGSILGTPGYMAPEQIRGLAVDTQADVYSLGAMLFEMLVGEPLHPRGQAAIATTLAQAQVAPQERAPDKSIAPELDGLCFRCLSELPERRPTAHELAETIENYLDGDRDLAARRRLAAELAASARSAFESTDPDARAIATRRAGRAIALDPTNVDAGELLSHLALKPPERKDYPPELVRELDESEAALSSQRSRNARYAYLSIFAMLPLTAIITVTNWTLVISFYGLVAAGLVLAHISATTGRPRVAPIFAVTLCLALMFTRIASPFVITPLAICAGIAALTPIAWFMARPWALFLWTGLAVLVPFVLEWVGLFPRTWVFDGHGLVITSSIVDIRSRAEGLSLVVTNFAFTLLICWLTLKINQQRSAAQHAEFVTAWHLRQLLPGKNKWDMKV